MSFIKVSQEDIFHLKIGVGALRTPCRGPKKEFLGPSGGHFEAAQRGLLCFPPDGQSAARIQRVRIEGRQFQISRCQMSSRYDPSFIIIPRDVM